MSVAAHRGSDLRNEMGPVERFVRSHLGRLLVSPALARGRAWWFESRRRISGSKHRIDYFHQVDDPYSHLAVQALRTLAEAYEVEFVPQLAARSAGATNPEPKLLARHAVRDCAWIAPHYGLQFPSEPVPPMPESIRSVERALVADMAAGVDFTERAIESGAALWSGDRAALARACGDPTEDPTEEGDAAVEAAVSAGAAERARLGHYSGAMFYYAGDWYWGVDRLHHLEARLSALGLARSAAALRFPRPEIEMARVAHPEGMRLEIFPSLRSPYTAIGFERAVELAERTGIAHVVRPVLPMVMRGVPVPAAKAKYIMRDTHREAVAIGMPFGRLYDPVGEPVRRGYSLWPWAREQGRGDAYLAAFLRAAFADGINTANAAGLRQVVERAGLDWDAARRHLGDRSWEDELEANRRLLIDELEEWGVPSFRLKGPAGEPDLCTWGQDRIWLLAREIQRRGNAG